MADATNDVLRIVVSFTHNDTSLASLQNDYSESGLGLSVCRLMARRLWGDVVVDQQEAGRLRYVIILPIDARKASQEAYPRRSGDKDIDLLEELSQERNAEIQATLNSRASLPHVLIGMSDNASLYRNQHLFDVTVTRTTDDLRDAFGKTDPDIIFIDSHLPGTVSPEALIADIHQMSPQTPIIVTDDYAQRPLHRHIQRLGARYLITNPLSLRKVNMMIKKYLK